MYPFADGRTRRHAQPPRTPFRQRADPKKPTNHRWRLGIPLGRLADPSDQAAIAVFLAGDGARHITGQDLAVDGGQTTV
jgi:NAD(P)-dependent dehydrogenase (short-subunit alcohol dehydrogenase family)